MVLVQNKYKNTLVGVLRTQLTFVTHSSPSCYVTLRTQVIRLNSGNLDPQKTNSGVFIIRSPSGARYRRYTPLHGIFVFNISMISKSVKIVFIVQSLFDGPEIAIHPISRLKLSRLCVYTGQNFLIQIAIQAILLCVNVLFFLIRQQSRP